MSSVESLNTIKHIPKVDTKGLADKGKEYETLEAKKDIDNLTT